MFLEIANDCAFEAATRRERGSAGARRLICCCARKSVKQALVRKGLGRGSRSRRDSKGCEAGWGRYE